MDQPIQIIEQAVAQLEQQFMQRALGVIRDALGTLVQPTVELQQIVDAEVAKVEVARESTRAKRLGRPPMSMSDRVIAYAKRKPGTSLKELRAAKISMGTVYKLVKEKKLRLAGGARARKIYVAKPTK